MYQHPSQQPSQSQQQPASQSQQQQQQPPPPQQSPHPPSSSSHGTPHSQFRQGQDAPPGTAYGPPPGAQHPNRPDMATIHPQYQQQPYDQHMRLPAPHGGPYYAQAPPQSAAFPQQASQAQAAGQPAPRQRTAIACKYCRRRKIRCSGFENAPDGRCTNCVRFNQECIFTPVSQTTQAFVPAQAVYGRRNTGPQQGSPPQLYGPYGQPLRAEGYPPGAQYSLPSPNHPSPGQPYYNQGYGYHPQSYPYDPAQAQAQAQQAQAQAGARRRRPSDEPHTPTLPPPNPGPGSHLAGHEPGSYAYPEQPAYPGSPATAQGPYQTPYYAQSRRASPGSSAYSYEQPPRVSPSPHAQQGPYYGPPGGQAQSAPQGRTPPPADRGGLAIRDIVSDPAQGERERTAADSDMVSALNRTSRR